MQLARCSAGTSGQASEITDAEVVRADSGSPVEDEAAVSG